MEHGSGTRLVAADTTDKAYPPAASNEQALRRRRRRRRRRRADAVSLASAVFIAIALLAAGTTTATARARIFLPAVGIDRIRPPSPIEQSGGMLHGVATDGRYAYAVIGPRLAVIDLEPDSAPSMVWRSPMLAGTISSVVVTQQRVWLSTNQGARLYAFDVQDPRSPLLVFDGRAPNGWSSLVGASGNLLIVQSDWSGLGLIDVSAMSRPVAVGSVLLRDVGIPQRTVVRGHHAFVVRYLDPDTAPGPPGLAVIDINRPAAPRELDLLRLPVGGGRAEESPWHIDLAGDRLIAASYERAWWIDVARPAAPRVVGSVESRGIEPAPPADRVSSAWIRDVAQVDRTTWILRGDGGDHAELVSIDARDAARPRTIASLALPPALTLARGGSRLIAFESDYGDASFSVVDAARPDAPRLRGRFAALGYIAHAWPFDDRLIAAGYGTVAIGAIRSADHSSNGAGGGASWLASIADIRAVVGAAHDEVWMSERTSIDYSNRLTGWDITDPARPVARWRASPPGPTGGFAAAGNVRYFGSAAVGVDGHIAAAGLLSIAVTAPNAPATFATLSGDADDVPERLAIDGDRLYAANRRSLWAVDIRRPLAWREVSRAPIGVRDVDPAPAVLDVSVQNGTVLVATEAGVAAFTAADAEGLRSVGGTLVPPAADAWAPNQVAKHTAAASSAGRLYVLTVLDDAVRSQRVTAYDVTRPLEPVALWARTYPGELPYAPCGLGADERTVVIAACDAGMLLFDAP